MQWKRTQENMQYIQENQNTQAKGKALAIKLNFAKII